MKLWLKSWTILFNLGLLATTLLWPKLGSAVCGNAELTLQLVVLVNVLLRFKTDSAVKLRSISILGLLALSACSSVPQKLDPKLFYRNDMPFCVEGYGCFEGTTVLPRMPSYKFELAPKGDAQVDFFVATTCNRNNTFEPGDKGFTWDVLGLFGGKKKGLKYIYVPLPGKEDDGDCNLILHTYEKQKGRHAWAFVRFEHPKYNMPATLYCDGLERKYSGVSVCQAKAGLIQWATFPEPVMIEPGRTEKGAACAPLHRDSTGAYAWRITKEECHYAILGRSGARHDMITIGYEGELVRQQGAQ